MTEASITLVSDTKEEIIEALTIMLERIATEDFPWAKTIRSRIKIVTRP